MSFPMRAREGSYTTERRPYRDPDSRHSKPGNGNGNGNGHARYAKAAPPESTNAENFYWMKQMNAKTPIVVVMTDGEEIRGWIEWYDKNCIKVNREGAPNLLIQKHCIKYVFKQEELVS